MPMLQALIRLSLFQASLLTISVRGSILHVLYVVPLVITYSQRIDERRRKSFGSINMIGIFDLVLRGADELVYFEQSSANYVLSKMIAVLFFKR